MIESSEQREATTECGMGSKKRPSSCTLEHPRRSKKARSKAKKSSCSSATQTASSSLILDLGSIKKDEATSPFWNELCKANQSSWWLPQVIESQGPASRSSSQSSNYTEERSSFWKRTFRSNSTSPCSLLSLPLSATPSTGVDLAGAIVKTTRKVRVYPKKAELRLGLEELLRQSRRAYNLAIEKFKLMSQDPSLRDSEEFKLVPLRRAIKELVDKERKERGAEAFYAEIVRETVRKAFAVKSAVLKKRKQGLSADYSFRSRKSPVQTFVFPRLNKSFVSRYFTLSEKLPEESFGRTTNISFERGRWFINAQFHQVVKPRTDIQGLKVVAIDPGVRTFATTYSSQEVIKYGDGFYARRIWHLLLKLDKLVSLRARTANEQWHRHYTKRMDRLKNRIRDLVDDLHRRVAYDLVTNYDAILLPKFETQPMSSKTERKIRTKTVRSMLGLGHYRFQRMMEWMCRKYGKTLVICNEAYTSKTKSWSGEVVSNLGGAKSLRGEGFKVDRDVNGARNILLRALYRICTASREHPQPSCCGYCA